MAEKVSVAPPLHSGHEVSYCWYHDGNDVSNFVEYQARDLYNTESTRLNFKNK